MDVITIVLIVAVVLLIAFVVRFGTAMNRLEGRVAELEERGSQG